MSKKDEKVKNLLVKRLLVKRLLRIEPSQRWVRAQVGDEFVVNCKRPLLVWEHEKYPTYFVPREEVRMDWLEEADQTSSRSFWD